MFARRGQVVPSLIVVALCLWLSADATLSEQAPARLLGSFRVTPGRLPGLAFASFPTDPPRYEGALRRTLLRERGQEAAASLIDLAFGRTAHEILEIKGSLRSSQDPLQACQLSALYLRLVVDGEEPLLNAARALTWAGVALKLQPDMAEARFNQALSLEHLSLTKDAEKAWRAYLRIDGVSSWAREARHRLLLLTAMPSYEEKWREARKSLNERGASARSLAIVKEFIQPTRLWIERYLLKGWALSHRDHEKLESEERWISQALEISSILSQETGDVLTLEAVRAIHNALVRRETARLDQLSEGELTLIGAIERHELVTGCRAEDEEQFRLSEGLLRTAGSPMKFWATFYLANCSYRKRDYGRARRQLARMAPACQANHYRTLCGRMQWLNGLMFFHQNRIGEASSAYSMAHDLLAEEKPYLAAINLFQSEVFLLLGERARAWTSLAASLNQIETLPYSESKRKQAILQGVARLAGVEGQVAAALRFEVAALKVAKSSPEKIDDALILRERAEIQYKAGNIHAAMVDLQSAEVELGGAKDESTQSLWAEIQVLRGEIFPGSQAAKDQAALVNLLETTSARIVLPQALLSLGRAYARENNFHAAEEAWQRGLNELDQLRPSLGGRQQSDFFAQRDAFLAELLPLQIRIDSSGSRAFCSVDRARRRSSIYHSPSQVTVEQLQRNLPPGYILLEYAVLPDRLLIWAIGCGHVTFRSVLVSMPQLSAWLDRLQGGNERELSDALTSLHELLIQPVMANIPPRATLLVVPDWRLYAVPFAALRDPVRGRFLVQDYLLTGLPDATSALRVDSRHQTPGHSFRSILVLGDPAFSQEQHPALTRLPKAAEEAAAVWRLYAPTWSRLRLQEQATASELLRGLGHYEIIHYGGHALAQSPDPALARLILAPDAGHSGDLSANELYGRDFSGTRLVVLAACETAAAGAWVSHGGLEGFIEPLLEGGVRNVLASLWKVDNEAARQQAVEFHRELRRGGDVLLSLAQVQRRALGRGEPIRRWASWAIFGGVP